MLCPWKRKDNRPKKVFTKGQFTNLILLHISSGTAAEVEAKTERKEEEKIWISGLSIQTLACILHTVCATDCITLEVPCCFKHELIIHFGAGHTCFYIKIHSLTENVSWIYLYVCVLTVYEGDHLTTEQRKHYGEHCNDLSLPRITLKLVTLPTSVSRFIPKMTEGVWSCLWHWEWWLCHLKFNFWHQHKFLCIDIEHA